jgi:predicted RNA-binding Zn-ribbon protein involved in translation (DUF1610 family)
MATRERNIDCSCGQPVDLVPTAIAAHCPRCGRIVSRSAATGAERPAYLAGPVLPTTRAA